MAFPATYNFNYYNGDTFEFLVYPKDSQGGVFPDLSSYTAKFTIAESRGGIPVLDSDVTRSSGSVVAETSELIAEIDQDHVLCEIIAEYGSELLNSSYVYDVKIQNGGSGKVYTVLTGNITVLQDVAG